MKKKNVPKPSSNQSHRVAMAIGAHPDDIEFYMAGTLLLLRNKGYAIHYMNVSSGSCGSLELTAAQTRAVRKRESQRAAKILGAAYHPSLADDLEILYELRLLRRLAAVIRAVQPNVLLIHSPQDYMEDHTNSCRLAVTAAFARGMPNFRTVPPRPPTVQEVALYHAMPHGLRDALRQPITPDSFVNTAQVHAIKRQALAAHQSQKAWLDASQGMDSYLLTMDQMSAEVGKLSGEFHHAEGWRRHSHLGFSSAEFDPLKIALGPDCLSNEKTSVPK